MRGGSLVYAQNLEKDGVRRVLGGSRFPVFIAMACPVPFHIQDFVHLEQ